MSNREKWNQFLSAIESGTKAWPMHEGKVNKKLLAEPEYTGISRSMLYQGALAEEIDAAIARVNETAVHEAHERLGKKSSPILSVQSAPHCHSKSADTAGTFKKKEEEYKRRINRLEQQLTETQAALAKALQKIRQYEHERNTGRIAMPY